MKNLTSIVSNNNNTNMESIMKNQTSIYSISLYSKLAQAQYSYNKYLAHHDSGAGLDEILNELATVLASYKRLFKPEEVCMQKSYTYELELALERIALEADRKLVINVFVPEEVEMSDEDYIEEWLKLNERLIQGELDSFFMPRDVYEAARGLSDSTYVESVIPEKQQLPVRTMTLEYSLMGEYKKVKTEDGVRLVRANPLTQSVTFKLKPRKVAKSITFSPVEDELVCDPRATYYDDLKEANETDEDIYDMGGAEFYVSQQNKAAIQCGDFDRVTKRSSVYEDGGDIGLVRVTTQNANENLFMNSVQAEQYVAAENAYIKALAKELGDRFTARRAKEIEARDFAIAEYKRIASLIVDEDSAVKYGERTDILVKAALKKEFGNEYFYQVPYQCSHVKYEYKGKKFGTFETAFHIMMQEKFIKPAIASIVDNKRKAAFERLRRQVDSIPGNNAKHVARLIRSSHKEIGIDRTKLADALAYAWESGEFFHTEIYYALVDLRDNKIAA